MPKEEMTDLQARRQDMVAHHLKSRGIKDPRVLQAMLEVPRECFVSPQTVELAYADSPLPIEEEQTISQPYVVALMAQAAEVKPGDRVLEVGTGSGYAAAILSRLAGQVYSIERFPRLSQSARLRLQDLGYSNVLCGLGDGTLGWAQHAPYDAIVVSAAPDEIPVALRQQLAEGGRLVVPVGPQGGLQRLLKVVRQGSGFRQQDLGAVQFVPLVNLQHQ